MSVSTMKRLTVLALEQDTDAIVRRLMRLKCVDIRRAEGEGLMPLDTARAGTQRAEAERRLGDIRRAMGLLSVYSKRWGFFGRPLHRVDRDAFCRDGRDLRAWEAVTDTLSVGGAREALARERTEGEALLRALEPWLSYDAPLNASGSVRTVQYLGTLPAKTDIATVSAELEAAGAYPETVGEDDYGIYLSVTALREENDAVERILLSRGFLKVHFPDVSTTASAATAQTEARLAEIDAEDEALEERMRDLAEQLDEIEVLCDLEATTVNFCRQKQKLARTGRCTVLTGWIPEDARERVLRVLSSFECAVELADPDEGEEPPVLLRNNSFAASFEWVIGMYSYPKYGAFDPTLVMSIFYFLIFGMMFADVGYGLLLVLGCFGGIRLLHLKPSMKRMLAMFGWCGVSCMIMGVLFGGWFGNLPTAIMNTFIYHAEGVAETTPIGSFFYNGLIFNPIDSATGFLVLALAMGEIHLIAGMAINMIETCKKGRVAEGICSTVPYWVLFLGIDLIAPQLFTNLFFGGVESLAPATASLFATLASVGKITMGVGFAAILFLKGVGQRSFFGWLIKGLGGLYSLISFASDLLSYSRILALGLVASVIAQVINLLTGVGTSGALGFVFMLVVMIVGHVLNLAINLLGTFVHAARLQYIEFFGKFYEDGGDPFDPAIPAEEFSEDGGQAVD